MNLTFSVDLAKTLYQLNAAFGASWHAIETPIQGHAGSSWGGNPPASRSDLWKQLSNHARWLGLKFCRVEIEQRMYNPHPNEFDYDNPDVAALYRILDHCQAHNVDVLLQQNWGNVEWNAHPGVEVLKSAPRDVNVYANAMATLAHHLLVEKKYSCIKWLCIANEPGPDWAWWRGPDGISDPLGPALYATRRALDEKKLPLPIIGPDWTSPTPEDPDRIEFARVLDAFDCHSYIQKYQAEPIGHSYIDRVFAAWAAFARKQNKPLLLTEFGTMDFGWGASRPEPGGYEANLRNAETILRGLSAGVQVFSRWNFTNRGDLDGQWQLVDTFDRAAKKHLEQFTPHPNSYNMYGLFSRFSAKNSLVLATDQSQAVLNNQQHVFLAALKSPRGNLTLFLLNNSESPANATLRFTSLDKPVSLTGYQVKDRDQTTPLSPQSTFNLNINKPTIETQLPPRSITTLSTFHLPSSAPGIITD